LLAHRDVLYPEIGCEAMPKSKLYNRVVWSHFGFVIKGLRSATFGRLALVFCKKKSKKIMGLAISEIFPVFIHEGHP
jgi:hypothetical protein